jgi:hypothetical protein
MVGSIQDLNAHNPVIFPDVQNDVFGQSPIDHLLLPIIQSNVN